MIIFWLEWVNFALTQSLIHLFWYFKPLWLLVHLLPSGKEASIFPIHKKNDKQISNNQPVSLLLIWLEIFEKLIFKELFKIFEDKNVLSKYLNIFAWLIHYLSTTCNRSWNLFKFWLQSISRDSQRVPWHI